MDDEKVLTSEQLSDDMFEFVQYDESKSEKIATPEYSYWGSVFRKFFSSKVAIIMLVILALVLLMSTLIILKLKLQA